MDAEGIERIRRFYVAHRQALFSYALSLTGAATAAEDAIQNAFSRVLRRDALPRELRPYVFRSVRNAAMDERRAQQRSEGHGSIFNGAQGATGDSQLRLDVEELLASLTVDEREAVVLKVYSGMTFDEIAGVRGVPLQTAASWYRRGMDKLRKAWRQEDGMQ